LILSIAPPIAIEQIPWTPSSELPKNHGMPTQQPPPQAILPVDARMTLVLTASGELVVRHTALAHPVPISAVQLANWLRRQLRETV
jgi:hypothetical protein